MVVFKTTFLYFANMYIFFGFLFHENILDLTSTLRRSEGYRLSDFRLIMKNPNSYNLFGEVFDEEQLVLVKNIFTGDSISFCRQR